MLQDIFTPHVYEITGENNHPLSVDEWHQYFFDFFNKYLKGLKEKNTVIGHIKGLLDCGDDHIIKYSSTDLSRPANVELNANKNRHVREVYFILNAILYTEDKELPRQSYINSMATSFDQLIIKEKESSNHEHHHKHTHTENCSCSHCHDTHHH